MMNRDLIVAASQALETQWKLELGGVSPFDLNRQLLLEALSERILALLRNRPEKLLSALYLLDIGELTYQQAMEQDTMEDRAWALAIAVYDRETEKIRLRERYSRNALTDHKTNTTDSTD